MVLDVSVSAVHIHPALIHQKKCKVVEFYFGVDFIGRSRFHICIKLQLTEKGALTYNACVFLWYLPSHS